jgi:hypothetical protein
LGPHYAKFVIESVTVSRATLYFQLRRAAAEELFMLREMLLEHFGNFDVEEDAVLNRN